VSRLRRNPRRFSPEHENRVRTGKARLTPCSDCRHSHPKPTESDREFWLERFTLAEIHELAEAIWPHC
jgi:hypothetical protein